MKNYNLGLITILSLLIVFWVWVVWQLIPFVNKVSGAFSGIK